MADRDRDADASGADREVGQLENLARLLTDLHLLVELLAVVLPVRREVVLRLGLPEQLPKP